MTQDRIGDFNFRRPAPAARLTGLVTTESDNELLVYDTSRHQIHHLNATSTTVWRLLDGSRTLGEVAQAAAIELGTPVPDEVAQAALVQLSEANLLDGPLSGELRVSGQSRRKLMKRAALAGAGAAIVSITAPMAVDAQSGCTNTCTQQNQSSCCTCSGGILRATGQGCININSQVYVNVCAAVCVL